MSKSTLLVTAASGQLGRLVVGALLRAEPAERIALTVRRPEIAAEFAARGLRAHIADYDDPQALAAAFTGADRVLLISSSAIGVRVAQHRNVIEAAKRAGVGLLTYTSLLHADTSTIGLAEEHRQTEAALRDSGVPWVLLRNGWYTENSTASIPAILAHGAVLGSAGEGRIASAARADYAAAAAAVLTSAEPQGGRVYGLAGDTSYTKAEFAAEVARRSGRPVVYKNLPQSEYETMLKGAGFPAEVAALLADADAAHGALDDSSGTLSRLIGRPTTPMGDTVAAALEAIK